MHLKTLTPERQVSESGYRSYFPSLGRFVSRDPLGENGFADTPSLLKGTLDSGSPFEWPNLYPFVNNEPVGSVDLLGLYIELWYGTHPVAWGEHHSKLWLITDEFALVAQAASPPATYFPFRAALSKTEIAPANFVGPECTWALTIGAAIDLPDDMVASFDRAQDYQNDLATPALVHTFADIPAALAFLTTVAARNQTMNDNFDNTTLEYEMYPGASYTAWNQWDEFNSNGYISGLLATFGYPAPTPTVSVPGWTKPVPGFVFTTAFASNAALQVQWTAAFPPPP